MSTSREQIVEKYFLNLGLSKGDSDIYYVRNSILRAVKANLHKFYGTLLDVGCGIMPYRELIRENNPRVSTYIGLDFDAPLTWEFSVCKPDLIWDGKNIPLGNESVDCIMATELFEHCPEPENVMREMYRVIRPGGLIFFTVPFIWNLHLVPYDEYRYTPFSLRRHLSNAGFVDIELEALGGLDASLAQMLGIWLQRRQLSRAVKAALAVLILPLMKLLIKKDLRTNTKAVFSDGTMYTGLHGVAFKKNV
ncbi:class I SAM-dependent methyltransferase [Pontibacter litorisediminis]|uniref:class I SAM-dependent methyltransferase n=1 Tax=Pontibacter litorisediminis TaxID=1846260 RepID=UPI0023ECA010|nr:class I SAM-dependent methyltransferase [Pontibacter litorisediminis]